MNLAAAVQTARKASGWSVRTLGERADLSPSTISSIENGRREMTVKTAEQIAKALNLDIESLFRLARKIESTNSEKDRLESAMIQQALQLMNATVVSTNELQIEH